MLTTRLPSHPDARYRVKMFSSVYCKSHTDGNAMAKIMSFHCSFEMYSVGDVAEGDGQGVLCSRSGS